MPLTTKDYEYAAKALECDVAAIIAVDKVESNGNGFLPSGEPKILFERHWMNRLLRKKGIIVRDKPDIVNTSAGGYKGGKAEHDRLAKAVEIDRESALQSASWGRYQILGVNWNRTGHKSLQSFINAMYKNEKEHLKCFVNFIKSDQKLHKALQDKDWATFAYLYNGPLYQKNKYDLKLALEYNKAELARLGVA